MEKFTTKNRKGQNLVGILDRPKNAKGLVFIAHGLGGYKEELHITAVAEAFYENDYIVVRYDAADTVGESGGNVENATVTSYYEDLVDVIEWARAQDWYQEPFILAGHSLGGISVALYAEHFPEQVKALAPLASVVSGALSAKSKAYQDHEYYKMWQETGWGRENISPKGVVWRLPWSHMEDRLRYDLLPDAYKLTMPTLFVVGDKDINTPPEHQKLLCNAVTGEKELHILENTDHVYRNPEYKVDELKGIVDSWIKKLEQM